MLRKQSEIVEQKRIDIDYQRNTATVSLKGTLPLVAIVSNGDAQSFQLPKYGELTVKVQDGKVTFATVSENHKM